MAAPTRPSITTSSVREGRGVGASVPRQEVVSYGYGMCTDQEIGDGPVPRTSRLAITHPPHSGVVCDRRIDGRGGSVDFPQCAIQGWPTSECRHQLCIDDIARHDGAHVASSAQSGLRPFAVLVVRREHVEQDARVDSGNHLPRISSR